MKRVLLAIGVLLAWCAPSAAAPAFVQDAANSAAVSTATQTATFSSGTTAGNLIVACSTASGGDTFGVPTVSGVSDGTSAFTHFTGANLSHDVGGNFDIEDCYFLASANATKTVITITFSLVGAYYKELWVSEYSGIASPLTDGVNTISAGAATLLVATGGSVTPSVATGVIVGYCAPDNSVVQNPQTGNAFTGAPNGTFDGFGGVYLLSPSVASHTPVWTLDTSGGRFSSIVLGFKPTGGGATVYPNTLTTLGAGPGQ